MAPMTMDRRSACLHQAALCRERAKAEPARQAFWIAEARKWAQRADDEVGEVAVFIERPRPQRPS